MPHTDDHDADDFDDFDDFEETHWTPDAREALLTRGRDLIAVLQAQLDLYASATVGTPETEVWASAERLEKAAVEYADAEFGFTGSNGPFGRLVEWDDDDDNDDVDEDDGETQIVSVISVLQRADYGVVDESAILTAGKAAFLADQPEQSDANAEIHAGHLGVALYQIAHTRGWDSLVDVPGLAPLGSVIQVIAPDEIPELADDDSDERPPAFGVAGSVLFAEKNRYC